MTWKVTHKCSFNTVVNLDLPGGPVVRILLPILGTWVQPLVWEDSVATKPCTTTAEAQVLQNPCSTTVEATQWEVCALQPESSPHSLQLEKPHPQRPSTVNIDIDMCMYIYIHTYCSQFIPTVVSYIMEDLKKYPFEFNWYYQVAIINLKT